MCNQSPELSLSCKPEALYPLNNKSPLPPPLPSPLKPPLSFYYEFDYSWVPHISGLIQYLPFCDWLVSLTIMSFRFIYIVTCVRIFFLLSLNNILLYVYATFCLSIHLLKDLGCFYLLAIGVMMLWTWLYKYCFKTLFSILLSLNQEVEFGGHMIILFSIFWGTATLFSMAKAPFYCVDFYFYWLSLNILSPEWINSFKRLFV